MEKKQYIQPNAEIVRFKQESLTITASPGVGGEYNPSQPIESKRGFFDEEDETSESSWSRQNIWEE